MKSIYVIPLVVAILGLRLWLRRRRRGLGLDHEQSPGTEGGQGGQAGVASTAGASVPRPRAPIGLGPFTNLALIVAAREIRERLRGRIFRVGTLIILAVVAAAIIIPTLTSGGGNAGAEQVGVVGTFTSSLRSTVFTTGTNVGAGVHLIPEKNAQAAKHDLRSGRLDVALIDGRSLEVDQSIGAGDTSTNAQFIGLLALNLGVARAFETAGLTTAQANAIIHAKPVAVASLQKGNTKGTVHTTSIVGLILTFVMLTQYNTWILIGVMEEKSSRVVEVLLAAVRPVQLLAGKVLGIGLVALAQATVIVGFALALAGAVGSDLLHGSAPLELISTLLWLVLGYTFYCWVYAAAGSMAERQDQVQSLVFPLTLPIIFGYVVSITAASSGNASTFIKVLAFVPLTAPFAMPVLVGLKAVAWWEFAISVLLSLAATVLVARLAATIYRRAILRTGRRVSLREVLARS